MIAVGCCGSTKSFPIPCVDVGGNCVTIILLILFAIALGYVICQGVRSRHRLTPDRETIEKEKVNLANQAARFKRGVRVIADADDPLEAFISALQRNDNHPPSEKSK